MSRIKYPGEQEMKRQIQVILDESGMFEDDEKSQGYTECVQVKKRPAVKTAILFPLAAAAVMFLVVTAAGLIPQQTNSRVEPMTNVLTDDTIRSVSKTQLSDDITVQICTDCSYLPLKHPGQTAYRTDRYSLVIRIRKFIIREQRWSLLRAITRTESNS